MEMKLLKNGLKKSTNRKRRTKKRGKRNPTTAAKTVRRTTTKAGATAFAKRNGLKLVKKSAANPKRRKSRKRRNGLTVTRTAKNGFFGNTKNDAKQVLSVLGGMVGTKLAGSTLNSIVASYLASFGVGNYSDLIVDGFVALTVTPYVAQMVAGQEAKKLARLGGLAVVVLDAIAKFFPQLNINPFNNAPIVINSNGQALLTSNGALSLANAAGADTSVTAKMAGAMKRVASSVASPSGYPTFQTVDANDGWGN